MLKKLRWNFCPLGTLTVTHSPSHIYFHKHISSFLIMFCDPYQDDLQHCLDITFKYFKKKLDISMEAKDAHIWLRNLSSHKYVLGHAILNYVQKTKYWGKSTPPWSLSCWRCRVMRGDVRIHLSDCIETLPFCFACSMLQWWVSWI